MSRLSRARTPARRPRPTLVAAAALAFALAAALLATPPSALAQPGGGHAAAEAWPQQHGDTGNTRQGVVAGPADPGVKWLATAAELISDDAPDGYSSFGSGGSGLVLAPDGTVVLTARATGLSVGEGNSQLIGLDPDDGTRAWNLPFVDAQCTPAMDTQGRVWVHRNNNSPDFGSTTLQAVDPTDGKPISGSELEDVVGCSGTPMHLGGASDHIAYMDGAGGTRADTLAVYDVSGDTAVEAWVLDTDDTLLIGNSTEPAITFTDTEVIVPKRTQDRTDVTLVAYDLATGAVSSELTLPLPALDPADDAPDGDDVATVQLLKADPDTLIAAVGARGNLQAYFAEVTLTGALGLGWTTELVLEQPTGEFGVQRVTDVALGDGVVVTKLRTGPLAAFRLTDGEKVWDAPARSDEIITDADGAVYIATQVDGGSGAAASYSSTGELRWEIPATRAAEVLGIEDDGGWTNEAIPGPIAADGTLYLSDARGSNNRILAVDSSGGLAQAGPPMLGDPGVSRVDGGVDGTPVATAIEICQLLVEDGTAHSIALARDDDFADALTGSALPVDCILFTGGGPDGRLDPDTRAEIRRALGATGTVYVLGGPNAVSDPTTTTIQRDGFAVDRLDGPTRFETAESVATEVGVLLGGQSPDQVIVAFGEDWADAITVGAYAHATTTPIVLTQRDGLHPAAARIIDVITTTSPSAEVIIVGGAAVVGPEVEAVTPNPRRVAGPNRMATAVAIAEQLWPAVPASGTAFVLANLERGEAWTIALASAPLAAALRGPQLGLRATTYPDETSDYLRGLGLADLPSVVLLGDLGFISDDVAESVGESVEPR